MSDQELLQYAAIAMQGARHPRFMNFEVQEYTVALHLGSHRGAITAYWNPLTDGGDCFELAAWLKINIEHMRTMSGETFGINCWPTGRGDCGVSVDENLSDYSAAMKRAVVEAAAELGKQLEKDAKYEI